MPIRPICIVGEPVLHRVTDLIAPEDISGPDIQTLISDMYDTMDAANGVGLAATQVGVGLRIFVYDCPDFDGLTEPEDGSQVPRRRGEVINPVLTTSAVPLSMPDEDGDDEGCLSVPGESFPTGRAESARVTGLDRDGGPVDISGTGFFARCLQHEVGHLDGLLYIDALVGRHARAAKKAIKRNGWGTPGLTWTPGVDPDPFGH